MGRLLEKHGDFQKLMKVKRKLMKLQESNKSQQEKIKMSHSSSHKRLKKVKI